MMDTDTRKLKLEIIAAGEVAVAQLIKVAKQEIKAPKKNKKKGAASDEDRYEEEYDEVSSDRIKNAAMTKKIAIFDAFDILARIGLEREMIESHDKGEDNGTKQGFAEKRSGK